MEVRKHNKRQINCQNFINILYRRRHAVSFFHTFPRVKWQHRCLCQMAVLCSSASLLWLSGSHIYSIPYSENHPQSKYILQYLIPNNDLSQWPCSLRRRSVDARLLRWWVRIPRDPWTFVVNVVCCRKKSLRRADHSSRGVLPTVVRRCVWSRNLNNEEAMNHVGSHRHRKNNT
jgi:hypothetical protein